MLIQHKVGYLNTMIQHNVGAEFICATGGTLVTCGDFKTHTFTGPGTFTVNCVVVRKSKCRII
jgi:plastocyanin